MPCDVAHYDAFCAAIARDDLVEIEEAPFAEYAEGVVVAEVPEAGGCVVGLPPGVTRSIATTCAQRIRSGAAVSREAMLLIHPDYEPGWADVQRSLTAGEEGREERCLAAWRLCELALHRKPKSAGAWRFRSWLVLQHHVDHCCAVFDFDKELALSLRCCDKYPRNYYGWAHIYNVVTLPATTVQQRLSVIPLLRAFSVGRPSDHSALSSLQSVLTFLGESMADDAFAALVVTEMNEAKMMVAKRPAHESVWGHMRFATYMVAKNVSTESAYSAMESLACDHEADAATELSEGLAARDRRDAVLWCARYCAWVCRHCEGVAQVAAADSAVAKMLERDSSLVITG